MPSQVNKRSQHELVTPAEYARRRGVTRAAVSKAILRCRIPLTDGLLDPLVAETLWKARTDPDQQRRALGQQKPVEAAPAKSEGPNTNWREQRDKAEAEKAQIELARLKGDLVPREENDKSASSLASAILQQMMSIPDRISAEFGIDDEHRSKLRQRLLEEINRIRAEFGRGGVVVA
jgi:hypothetical protein